MLSPFLKRLLFARQFFIIDGKVEILGVREMIVPTETILELQKLDEKKSYEIVKNLTNEKIKLFAKKLGASSTGMINETKEIFETFGLGSLRIIDLNNKQKKAIIRIIESPFATSYLQKIGKRSNKTTCLFISAFLAGMFSFLFNKNSDVQEKSCMAQGKEYCEFIIKSSGKKA